ncbi:hypothetical protein M413DRAFT_24844 [Hebeloma cylindrosporum]|uniref:Uncharacterized protein n=1 Tax=Hebeloma cylindrosporum TaxID=76867 RepID=A0A0C2YXM1_HEBCY|nr:hypothetical protein M413DRAFT_24844 [Hebeloma cylindrosporum h7]
MGSTKEITEMLVGVIWKGHSDEGLSCEYLLKKAMGLPTVVAGEAEYIKKNKFGCTCGICAEGWLSPRMRFQLLAQSEIQGDMLRMDDTMFTPRQPLSASDLFHPALEYLPTPLQRQIYKTFYIGFYTLFDGIAHILRIPNAIPTPQAVIAAAFDINPGASSLGDGVFEETFDVDESELGFRKLVRCANDLEFGAVRLGVGLGRGTGVGWGPFVDRQEMEVDGYDDDSDSG